MRRERTNGGNKERGNGELGQKREAEGNRRKRYEERKGRKIKM